MVKNTKQGHRVNRRKYMTLAGSIGAVGLAGCLGNDNGDGNGNGSGDGGSGQDEELALPITAADPGNLEGLQFNLYADNNLGDWRGFTYDALAYYNSNTGELDPHIATDWYFEDDTFTIETYEGHKWQNGDQLTADDIVAQLRLEEYRGDPMWDLIDEVEAVDETTIELTKSNSNTSNKLVERQVLANPDRVNIRIIHANPTVYGEYLEALEDASSTEEEDETILELNELTLSESDDVGSGMFRYVEHDATSYRLELFEDYESLHTTADDIDIDAIEAMWFNENSENMTLWQESDPVAGDTGGDPGFYERNFFGEDWFQTPTYHEGFGHGTAFNMDDPVYGIREVRQAIAYIIDKEAAANQSPYLAPQVAEPSNTNIGLTNTNTENFIEDPDVFDPYERTDENLQKAEQLLEEAGFSKENGTWVGEVEGETLETTYRTPPYWEAHSLSMVNDMQDFGLPIELQVEEGTTFWADWDAGENWRLVMMEWGRGIHPWVSWAHQQGGFALDSNLGVHFPDEIEVPMPVGDPDGDMETVAVRDKLSELEVAGEDEQSDIMMEIAWIWNWTVPFAQVFDYNQMIYYRNDQWDFPDHDTEVAGNFDSVSASLKFGEATGLR